MKKSMFFFISIMLMISATLSAQNPTVKNGVATYHSNKNIGRKYKVPDSWNKIIIKKNVTITGSFYFPTRTKPMEIMGESRKTSIIKGDGSRPTNDGINGRSYSAIRFDKSPDVYIHDLRSLNPMKFHIGGGFGKVTVERCDLIENRGAHSSDGIHGGNRKVIVRDCYIDTWDDALYTRECTLVENTTIVHNKNGSPFMTSWGASIDNGTTCVIRNCTVIDNSNIGYNHGVVAWAGKHDHKAQTVTLKFQGSFTRKTNPGKKASTMYTIGRPTGNNLKNATIKVDGKCPSKGSVDIRKGCSNSKVVFVNCGSTGGGGGGTPSGDFVSIQGNNGKYVSSENGTKAMMCNRTSVAAWEKFTVVNAGGGKIALKGNNGKYVSNGSPMWCNVNSITNAAKFTKVNVGGGKIALKGSNNKFVSSENGLKPMNCNRAIAQGWEKFTLKSVKSASSAMPVKSSDVKIYPNPAYSTLTIELNKLQESNIVEIFNTNGQLMLSRKLNNNMEQINLETLKQGLYLVKIQNGSSIQTRTIIKK
ncbi:MAG: T9SS type A sorting domain-containing protein [Bacteroidales bacterium]|nr:T9SS type A sorting domain-containing protein [Bacteroidales bacterium]